MNNTELKYSRNKLLEIYNKRDNPVLLFKCLGKIYRGNGQEGKDLAVRYVIKLNKEFKVDFFSLSQKAIINGFNWYLLLGLLIDSVTHLQYKTNSLLDFLKFSDNQNKNDLLYGKHYDIVERISNTKPFLAFDILDKLVKNKSEFIIPNTWIILINLFKKYPAKIWEITLSLSKSKNTNLRSSAILAFGSFEYKLARDKKKLKYSTEYLEVIITQKEEVYYSNVVIAFSRIIKKYPEANKSILYLSKLQNSKVQYSVSNALWLLFEDYHTQEWFQKSFMNLTMIRSKDRGTIQTIDLILGKFIEIELHQDLVIDFIIMWKKARDRRTKNVKLKEEFQTSIYDLLSKKTLVEKLFTKILNHDDPIVNHLVMEFVNELVLLETPYTELNYEIINKCSFEDLRYISRKILGYLFDSKLSTFLVLSILRRDKVDDNIKGLVFDVIRNHIGRNYASSTIDILKQLLKENILNNVQKNISKKIVKSLEAYQKSFESLPNLKELRVSNTKKHRIRLTQSRSMSKSIRRATKESSIFMQLAQNVPLKYGVAWFSYFDGTYRESSPLKPISHTVELPKTEITDPVGSSYQRAIFRLAKRGEN